MVPTLRWELVVECCVPLRVLAAVVPAVELVVHVWPARVLAAAQHLEVVRS